MMSREGETLRRRVLTDLGANGPVVDELLAYNRNSFCEETPPRLPELPLADEPHLEAWREYAEQAAVIGSWATLSSRLVKLRFPIRGGISRERAYRRATLQGLEPTAEELGDGLGLRRPEALQLTLHPSPAGTMPVLSTPERPDFVALVQALASRNEPVEVPDSMGACLVSGFNNWDRIRTHRLRWQAADPAHHDTAAWPQELARLQQQKGRFQDRFIILAGGPYSNVAADDTGLAGDEWLEASHVIRLEHECTHYLSLRLFGRLQHSLLEELIADLVGLVAAFGCYRTDLALRFLGLEAFPQYRQGGRLEIYQGGSPLREEAFAVLARLVHAVITNLPVLLERSGSDLSSPESLVRLVVALSLQPIEALACSETELWRNGTGAR